MTVLLLINVYILALCGTKMKKREAPYQTAEFNHKISKRETKEEIEMRSSGANLRQVYKISKKMYIDKITHF